MYNTLKKHWVTIISISALLISAYSVFLKKQTPLIGVVDMKKMVSDLSKDLVKQYPTGQIPKNQMDHFIGYIHTRIQHYAEKNKKVIFLNKQNIVTGETYDCTDAIIDAIKQTE